MKYFTILLVAATLFYFGCSSKTTGGATTTTSTTATTPPSPPPTTNQTTTPPAPPKAETQLHSSSRNEAPGEITFFAENERYSAQGTFHRWRFAGLQMEGDNFESLQGIIEIDLTSIWEKSEKLTEHLKAWDYFDVAKHTTATIEIQGAHLHGEEGHAQLLLRMRGYEQPIEAHFQVINKNPYVIAGSASVNRAIFKIGEDNKDVPDEVQIEFNTPLVF